METEKDWIKKQGGCCLCGASAMMVDCMDNVYCQTCGERNMAEEPENWDLD